MKKIIVTIAAAMIALNVAAYNPGVDPDNYCVKSKNGTTVVEFNGSAIKKEIRFHDGTRLKPNGTVILTSGKTVKLKEGECVNESNVMSLSKHGTTTTGGQKGNENNPKDLKEGSKTDSTYNDRFKNNDKDLKEGSKTDSTYHNRFENKDKDLKDRSKTDSTSMNPDRSKGIEKNKDSDEEPK